MIAARISGTEPSLAGLVRLEEPEFYLDPHPVYDRMRIEQPVYYYAPLDIFVLTRHADMRAVARRPDLFSSVRGVVLSQLQNERDGATEIMDQFIDPEGEIFAFTDPPRHRELRKVLMPAFSPRAVHAMAAQIRESCRLLVASISPGALTDVVDQIAAPLPIGVATRLLGVPREHAADIKRWSDARELLTSGAGSRAAPACRGRLRRDERVPARAVRGQASASGRQPDVGLAQRGTRRGAALGAAPAHLLPSGPQRRQRHHAIAAGVLRHRLRSRGSRTRSASAFGGTRTSSISPSASGRTCV
jgi:cytochrome P450